MVDSCILAEVLKILTMKEWMSTLVLKDQEKKNKKRKRKGGILTADKDVDVQ